MAARTLVQIKIVIIATIHKSLLNVPLSIILTLSNFVLLNYFVCKTIEELEELHAQIKFRVKDDQH